MAIAFRSRGGVGTTNVYYPDVSSLPQAGDVVFLVTYGTTTITSDQASSNGTWTLVSTQGTGALFWKRIVTNMTTAQFVSLPSGTRGQMIAFSGVRASGAPYSQVVGQSPAGSNSTTVSPGLSDYDKTNAFLVGFFSRFGDVVTADNVSFQNVSGGTSVEATPTVNTGGAGGAVFIGYHDGTGGSDGATVTFGNSNLTSRSNRGLWLLDLTDASPTQPVQTTVATSWLTDGPPPLVSFRSVGPTSRNTTVTGIDVYYPDTPELPKFGDVVFMPIWWEGATGISLSESGWNLAQRVNAPSGGRKLSLYWKRLDADAVAGQKVTVTFVGGSATVASHMMAYYNLYTLGDPWYSLNTASDTSTEISVSSTAFGPNEAFFVGIVGRTSGFPNSTMTISNVTNGSNVVMRNDAQSSDSAQVASVRNDGTGAVSPVTFTAGWAGSGSGNADTVAILLDLKGQVDEVEVSATVSTGWDIETQVVATASTTYAVSEVTSASLSAGTWNVASTIAPATKSVSWGVRQPTAEFTSATSWNTESGFGKIIVLPSSPVPVSNPGGTLDSPSFDVLAGQTVLVVAQMRTAQFAELTSPGITDLDLGHTFTQLGFEGGSGQLSSGRIWTKISQAKITSSGTMRVRLTGPAAVAAQGLTIFVLANVQESGGFRMPLFDSQLNSADTTTAVGLTTQGYNSRVFFGSASVGSTFATSTGGDGQRSWIYLSNAAGVVYWQQVDGEPGVAVSRTFTETVGEAMHSFVLEVTPQPAPGSLLEVTAARSAGTWNTRTAMAAPATAAATWQTRSAVAAATASTAWTITALVVFKPSSTWNTTTAVHGGPGTEWRAYQNAQTTASTEWTALVSDLVSRHPTEWGVSAVLTALVGSTWGVTRSVQAGDYSTSWGTAAGVQTTAGTDWSAYQSTTKNLTTRWNLHSAVDLHRDQTWKVFTTAQVGDYSTEWMVRAEALVLKQSGWDTRASAALTKPTVWKSFAEARALAVTEWRVTNVRFVDLTASTVWGVERGVLYTRSTAWTVRTAMQAAQSTTWNDLTRSATARPDTNWKVRALAGQKASTSWATVQTLATSRSTVWDTTEMFERYSPVLWDITDSVATSTGLTTWTTGGSVRVRPTTLWTVHPKFVAINDIGEAIVLPSMSARVRIGGTIVTVELGAVNGRLRLKKENN